MTFFKDLFNKAIYHSNDYLDKKIGNLDLTDTSKDMLYKIKNRALEGASDFINMSPMSGLATPGGPTTMLRPEAPSNPRALTTGEKVKNFFANIYNSTLGNMGLPKAHIVAEEDKNDKGEFEWSRANAADA